MNAKDNIMKQNTISRTLAIGAVVALALGVAASARADNKGCNDATLRGTFANSGTGFTTSSPGAGPFTGVLTETYDGKGGMTSTGIISVNGAIIQVTGRGTYTVNPDCTGTYTVQLSPIGATGHYYFSILDSGNEFRFVCTDPGFVFSGSSRRQFLEGDPSQ
jgi:hypothetical protein